MGDAAADSRDAGKKFDTSEDEHEPLCLHRDRREDEAEDCIRIKHCKTHEDTVDRS